MRNIPARHHVYAREIDPAERSSLRVVASFVADGATVLDLGCGTGALGRWLRRYNQRAEVDGVTLSEDESALAAAAYRRLVVGDLELLDLPETFGSAKYDVIVCADVLEHLRDPQRVLAQCRPLLREGGQLIASVPNAAYIGLIAELMEGQFRYRQEGLLDKTHLRFFTRTSLSEFLAEHGWAATSVETIERALPDSEFGAAIDLLPPAVARHLTALPDAFTYQFVVQCRPGAAAAPVGLSQPASTQAQFSAELFLAYSEDSFSQSSKVNVRGVIGESHQALRFEIKPSTKPLARLRLDPADRPGFMHLHDLRLLDSQGATRWIWTAHQQPAHPLMFSDVAQQQLFWNFSAANPALPTLILLGDDPWFELPIPSELLHAVGVSGGHLVVTCGWPMSADYLAAAQTIRELQAHQEKLQQETTSLRAFQTEQSAQLDAANRRLDSEHKDGLIARQKILDLLEERKRLLISQQVLRGQHERTRQQVADLSRHLQWIEQSTVFRLTRPLVQLKMALTGAAKTRRTVSRSVAIEPSALAVDVIVPVYRGLEDTRRCIDSVLGNECETSFRLIVINDASPEPDLTAWLREVAASDQRIVLLENGDNLGFVGTVNRGMAMSDASDVVLLNSDTEVANNWLDRLRRAAYSDTRVATVTPWSNNATICSYPRFCKPSPLPWGETTQSLDTLCAQINAGEVLDVPTGVGFCMYIRRDSLRSIGLFDEQHFGKGYGEENDFCCRARRLGWRNLHALDVFVLHSGGVSFGDSKRDREIAAQETLRSLHPEYEVLVTQYLDEDPARAYRHRLDIARAQCSPLPKVLAVTHDRAGGTLRHVFELAAHLQAQAVFLILRPSGGGRTRLEWASSHEGFALEFDMESQYESLLLLLRALGVSLVHIHHLLGHHPRVHGLADALGVPYDFTAHDHYSYCPQISLTFYDHRYCGEQGLEQCRRCLKRQPAPGGVDIEVWRAGHVRLLRDARHVLAPSRDMADRMSRFVPGADVRFAPHTDLGHHGRLPLPAPRQRNPGVPLKVAVIGALSVIKGADILEQTALLAARQGVPVEFHLIGYAYRALLTQPRAALTAYGAYQDEDLPKLLEWLSPDLVWFPAQWPETYSYTLSAALEAGLPVVVTDLGALPERVAGRAWSWVEPWDSKADGWLRFFERVHTEHFISSKPPVIPSGPHQISFPEKATKICKFNYSVDYVPAPATDVLPHAAPSLEWLESYRSGRPQSGVQSILTVFRRRLLQWITRLRATPGLRLVAKKIPRHWQTRVKSWLAR